MQPAAKSFPRILFASVLAGVLQMPIESLAQDANPALNAPDALAWTLFLQVNAKAATSGDSALFETWKSDHDTFQPNPPPWTTPSAALALQEPALLKAAQEIQAKTRRGPRPQVVPGGTPQQPSEETRRNKSAYEFIVGNNLYKISGLRAAFGKTLSFPVDAIEVKANWYPVLDPKDPTKSGIPGYTGAVSDTSKVYHVNTASDGKNMLSSPCMYLETRTELDVGDV